MSMRRLKGPLVLAAATLAALLTAGCGGAVKDAISGAASNAGVTVSLPVTLPATQETTPPGQPTPEVTTPAATTQPPAQQQTKAPKSAKPAETATATASGSNTALLWVLIAVAVVVVFGVILWFSRASGRRSATAARWQSRMVNAYSKGAALADAMRIAEAPGALYAPDATARWADIQSRADDLAQTLYALREAAPDDAQRAGAADVLGALQAVRAAMTAERGPDAARVPPERVRSRLMSFEAALRALRAPDQRLPY
jgi:nitrate reductase NapE component